MKWTLLSRVGTWQAISIILLLVYTNKAPGPYDLLHVFAVPAKQTVQEIMALQIFLTVVHSCVFWLQGRTLLQQFEQPPRNKKDEGEN